MGGRAGGSGRERPDLRNTCPLRRFQARKDPKKVRIWEVGGRGGVGSGPGTARPQKYMPSRPKKTQKRIFGRSAGGGGVKKYVPPKKGGVVIFVFSFWVACAFQLSAIRVFYFLVVCAFSVRSLLAAGSSILVLGTCDFFFSVISVFSFRVNCTFSGFASCFFAFRASCFRVLGLSAQHRHLFFAKSTQQLARRRLRSVEACQP